VQDRPAGLADAFLIGSDFVAGEPVAMILGDNIFYGHGLSGQLQKAATLTHGALIFGYHVKDPERYGVVELDEAGRALSIVEKPVHPRSSHAVPGLYFYDGTVSDRARRLRPSERGEFEITDLNRAYLEDGDLRVEQLSRGVAWLDAGTHESLLSAANFVHAVEERQGMMISCPEEIAFRRGFISERDLRSLVNGMGANGYSEYLLGVLREAEEA